MSPWTRVCGTETHTGFRRELLEHGSQTGLAQMARMKRKETFSSRGKDERRQQTAEQRSANCEARKRHVRLTLHKKGTESAQFNDQDNPPAGHLK